MPVVIQPRFPVMVLPRQPDRLVDALRVLFLQHIAPGVQLCGPGHLAGLVRQGHGRAQMVAVVMMDGYGALLRSLLLLQLLAHLLRHFYGVLVVDTQHDQAICARFGPILL